MSVTPGGGGPGGPAPPTLGVASTGLRNVAAVAPVDDNAFVRLTTAVRTAEAKLIKYPGHEEWTELFDLKADPYETRNLAADPQHAAPLARLRAELDAWYARLYGLTRDELRYILDPHGLSDAELEDITSDWEDPTCSGPHLLPENPTTTFPGETFRVLKEKETAKHGEYRTRRLVLEAWDRLTGG